MRRVVLDGLWLLLVVVVTGAGVWLASSLAAYLIRNPRHRYVLADYERRDGKTPRADCDVDQGESVAVRCALPEEGAYRVRLLSNGELYGTYNQVGEIEALRGR